MKIAIDIRTVTPVRSGVGNYVLSLLEGLKRVSPAEDLFLIGRAVNLEVAGRPSDPGLVHETTVSHESHPLGDLWEHYWLPQVLDKAQVDVLHGPATLIPFSRSSHASVVTIHDLVAFLFPETIPRKYAMYMRWLLRRVVERADRIISVSHNTKEDLRQVLGVDPDKVSVVYEAAKPVFQPVSDQGLLDYTSRKYGIDGPFLYHVGNIEPRKNLVRLIKAFLRAKPRLGRATRLVITGQKGWLTSKLYREFSTLELGEDVIFTGYVPHEDLPLLMNAAHAFVFPSLYEGFGLPVLEAMSCGTPVVTSNISSLPEIVGDAAVLVDPQSEESIAQGIIQVVEDTGLHDDLSVRGLKRAKTFSWDRAARETLEVYREVCRAKGRL